MEDWEDVFIDTLPKTKFSGFVHNLSDCDHVIREYSYITVLPYSYITVTRLYL